MIGITSVVDRNATFSVRKPAIYARIEKECKEYIDKQPNTTDHATILKSLWHKYLTTIIAGATRCGDRLLAAKIWESDECDHPQCGNARCGAGRRNYSCHHNKIKTGKYIKTKQVILDEIKSQTYHGEQRHRELTQLITRPCPELHPHVLRLASDKHEREDIEYLYALTANRDKSISDPHDVHGAHIVNVDDIDHLCVYTDGSCVMPKHQFLAHAGWGVAYGNKDCELNDFGPLESPASTIYRAEVRQHKL